MRDLRGPLLHEAVIVAVDVQQFRRACGRFLTGVTIVTTQADDGAPLGVTANSFASVSLEPPMVLVCLGKKLLSHDAFQVGRHYAVHVLGEEQAELSALFARRGAEKFGAVAHRRGLGGVPLLPDPLAVFECRVVQAHEGGDHTIFVGQVERLTLSARERPPLGFYGGQYAVLGHSSTRAPLPPDGTSTWALGWS